MKNSEVREAILEFMRGKSYAPLNAEALIQQIPIDGRQISHFWQVMLALEENGEIVKTRFATFGLPEKMGLVVGRFQLTSKGFGFVIPDNKGEGKDVFIPPRAIGGAMNNDRVMARIETRVSGMKPEGEVIRIIKRANNKIVGIFAKTGDFGFVVPDDKRIGQDIYIARKNFGGAKPGQKVVIEITAWPEERKSAEGRIIEVLGTPGDVGLEILSIIKQNDLPLEFPEEVINASKRVPVKISDADLRGRRDLRALPVVTIDGEDAKDLDDAVFVRQQGDDFLLGVHIADVSHYVRENALLDREARLRGTSVYLVDRVIPMLPERLSNGICSLNAGEDRLSMSCEMLVDRKGRIKAYEVFPSVIRVSKRLNYREVREILVDKDAVLLEKYRDLVPMLLEMEEVCKLLRNKRVVRGAVDFDFPEQKVILDEEGRPIDIVQRVRSISESIVEEFMLAANETVARHMSNQEWPFIYRVHDLPSEDKMTDLAQLLNNFNVKLPISEEIKPLEVQKALKQMQGRPEERLVATVTLRSMKQAVYQVENIGHFGLAAEYYTHFTSPIRRYPDLVVHRLLRQWLQNPSLKAAKRESLEAELGDIASNSSLRERAAAEAERATVDLKMAEYMAGHIGEEFVGTISGVTAFGMFVELANGVEGLVHISSLTDDYYEFQEQQYSLLGEHKRKAYRLGDKVRIEVLQVNITERNIDFIMAGENEAMRQQIMNQLLGRRGSSFSPKGGKSASSGSGKTAGNKKKTGRGPKDGKGGRGRKPAAPKTNRKK